MRTYTRAQKRTIKIALRDGLTPKQTATRVNSLKSTQKTGNTVTPQAIAHAYRRCNKEKW